MYLKGKLLKINFLFIEVWMEMEIPLDIFRHFMSSFVLKYRVKCCYSFSFEFLRKFTADEQISTPTKLSIFLMFCE